jgi:hypothetical protein
LNMNHGFKPHPNPSPEGRGLNYFGNETGLP